MWDESSRTPSTTLTRDKLEEAFLAIARDIGLPPDAVNQRFAFPEGDGAEADFVRRQRSADC